MTEEKKRPGRPPIPPSQRHSERVEMRCTLAQRKKLARLGGVEWVRRMIDEANEPH